VTHALLMDVEYACLPAAAMGRLAPLRGHPGVEIALQERNLWLRWHAGNEFVAGALFALKGCQLFSRRDDRWYAWGRAVPAFDVPDSLRFRPLDQVIFPAPVQPLSAEGFAVEPMDVRLVPDPVYRPTLALSCSLSAFLSWAESMPACALERFRAAIDGDRLFVLGKKLPWIDGAERYWGRSVLTPLGYRPDPELPDAWLRSALGINDSDILVLRHDGGDIIAQDHFTPVTLAALRLARKEAAR